MNNVRRSGTFIDQRTAPGWALWLTGLPASGKTTLAYHLQERLTELGIPAIILDSDAMRPILTPQPRYSDQERDAFYGRMVELSDMIVQQGGNVIVAATANKRVHRQQARSKLPLFVEVWVCCPVEICRDRDPKDLYRRAIAGEIRGFPAVDAIYEIPLAPDVVVNTAIQSCDEATDHILQHLLSRLGHWDTQGDEDGRKRQRLGSFIDGCVDHHRSENTKPAGEQQHIHDESDGV